ncbi:hypothetical protein L227DRAFT_568402 [Lentinus tigrinus ALCF2SS1-6]|uniref:Uncharacterized protein n=1 Tax=Lentinus tigrinus ALCF2SS1-6 TaxID=1328759 RepID=A0A5C2RNN6_9APHY|nr:hypothetical protein L227DRAFT_568402 [Lentinus tigrinus ALCF2SS1-6]
MIWICRSQIDADPGHCRSRSKIQYTNELWMICSAPGHLQIEPCSALGSICILTDQAAVELKLNLRIALPVRTVRTSRTPKGSPKSDIRQEAPEFIPEQAMNKRVKQRVRNRDENRSQRSEVGGPVGRSDGDQTKVGREVR